MFSGLDDKKGSVHGFFRSLEKEFAEGESLACGLNETTFHKGEIVADPPDRNSFERNVNLVCFSVPDGEVRFIASDLAEGA